MQDISLLIAFGAGILSFLSPCVLPLVPVYIASLCGPEIFEPKAGRSRIPIFFHSLSFVVGFSIVFTIMGASAGLVGFAISANLAIVRQISGSLLIVFGLFMLAATKVPWLNFERRLAPSMSNTTSYLRSFFIGAVFSLAWTPCVGPVLGGVLTLALGSKTVGHGAYLLAIYSLGLGLPFLIIGVALDFITPLLKRIHRYSTIIYIFGGVLLVVIGILILTNNLPYQ